MWGSILGPIHPLPGVPLPPPPPHPDTTNVPGYHPVFTGSQSLLSPEPQSLADHHLAIRYSFFSFILVLAKDYGPHERNPCPASVVPARCLLSPGWRGAGSPLGETEKHRRRATPWFGLCLTFHYVLGFDPQQQGDLAMMLRA